MSYLYPLIVFISMGLGDIGSTAKIKFVNDGHRLRACLAEAWSDLCTLGSIGVGAVQIFHSGSIVGSLIIFGLVMGSIVGTYVGQRLADRWDMEPASKDTLKLGR